MRKEELRTYIENHESEMIEDLKSLIRIPSEKQAAEPGKPFGAPAAEALAQGIEILEKYGFAVTNYDNYAIAADFNQEEKGLDILAHLDVVPAGEGWQETDPFTPLIKEGKMFGRGTADDKGPAIAAIYAMRAVKELGYPLKKNVRLVLGSDEECGSSDLEYYYKKEVEAPCTFSPDAEFPVINIEKGGMRGHFEKTSDAGTTGVRLVSLQAGTKLNVVPGKAYAELAGMAKEDLKTCADETEQKTGVSFVLEDTENGNVKITACGAFAHASTPEMGNNALTALLQLLASVPMEEGNVQSWLDRQLDSTKLDVKATRKLPEDKLSAVDLAQVADVDLANPQNFALPALLKMYVKMGCSLGATACYDPEFDCADVFVWLPFEQVKPRYQHYLH